MAWEPLLWDPATCWLAASRGGAAGSRYEPVPAASLASYVLLLRAIQ